MLRTKSLNHPMFACETFNRFFFVGQKQHQLFFFFGTQRWTSRWQTDVQPPPVISYNRKIIERNFWQFLVGGFNHLEKWWSSSMGLKDDIPYMKWNIIHSCLKPPTSDGFLAPTWWFQIYPLPVSLLFCHVFIDLTHPKVFTHGLRIPSDSLSESLPGFGGCNEFCLVMLGWFSL